MATKTQKGFTLIEILIVCAIMAIIAMISVAAFRNMYHASTLRTAGDEVFRALTDARTRTLSSEDGLVYGVRVSSTTVTRFVGGAYSAVATSNIPYQFEGGVTATGSLITTGTDIVFTRLTGASSASGTIYIRNETGTTTINVQSSGLIEYN